MSPPIASSVSQTIATVVFGITASIISIVTVWQSYRALKIWRGNRRVGEVDPGRATMTSNDQYHKLTIQCRPDIELGLRSDHHPNPTERFELPAPPFVPNVTPEEAGSVVQPGHQAGVEPSTDVSVGSQETSTTPSGIN